MEPAAHHPSRDGRAGRSQAIIKMLSASIRELEAAVDGWGEPYNFFELLRVCPRARVRRSDARARRTGESDQVDFLFELAPGNTTLRPFIIEARRRSAPPNCVHRSRSVVAAGATPQPDPCGASRAVTNREGRGRGIRAGGRCP
jgi:hypothetical protein